MTPTQLAARLDATNLKLDATEGAIESLCHEAATAGYAAVCVYPRSIRRCSGILAGSEVRVCTVAGFPHGRISLPALLAEVAQAADHGAHELDFVLPYPELIAGHTAQVAGDVRRTCEEIRACGMVSKVIVETCYLHREQKIAALRICEDAGADYIKTSTGFGAAGATVEDVRVFAKERSKPIRIKASGGIRTLPQALAMIEAGADRLGVSAAASLLKAATA